MGNLNRQTWISFLRVIAMLFIVGCHLAVESSIQMIQLASQFLNVGVQIFFMISGFLFGYRKADDNVFQWYQRRAKRIFPVYYCFLLILLMIYLITGQKLILKNWIVSICCLQGIQIYLYGAEHLWFLSVLCLCYIITPALNVLRRKSSGCLWMVVLTGSVLGQMITTYFISTQLGIYWMDLNLYMIAYLYGVYHKVLIEKTGVCLAVLLLAFGVIGRLAGRGLCDGTVTYDVMIVGITQGLIASGLFLFVEKLWHRRSKVIEFLDGISFEVYLTHYMLIVGPISLMGTTKYYVVNVLLVIVSAIVLSILLKIVVQWLMNGYIKKHD